ncbi:MAG: DUF302 domain-containing protein [Anaerolineae bacterium]|nr:DUF302 domain-containing protein [Anaerolineae bacterium]
MLSQPSTQLGISLQLNDDFETALLRVTDALKTEGFGILTEIDVKATLKKKIDVDFRPYKILGACNPALAHRALQAAPEIGLMLPCNVTVSQEDGFCQISIIDPIVMSDFIQHPALSPIAQDAKAKLERVAALLEKN